MRRPLVLKALVTLALALAIILPLRMIEGVVDERQAASAGVLQEIQRTAVGTQTLAGPVLVVPYRRTSLVEVVDPATSKTTTKSTVDEGTVELYPTSLSIDALVTSEKRHRGIYSALLYRAEHDLRGSFDVPAQFGIPSAAGTSYVFGEAYVLFGISDTRGILGTPNFRWNGAAGEWKGGTGGKGFSSGVRVAVGVLSAEARSYTYEGHIALSGTQTLDYVPLGHETTITMKSAWPHPSFGGQYLPDQRTITDHGFDASWRTTHLASNVVDAVRPCFQTTCNAIPNVMGVSFVEPVNVYLQTERAVKYGFLFVAFTFLVFLLFELLRKLAIHPVQYLLVGVALAVFFLLLVALAEHVPFVLAYAIASAACVLLIAFYVSHVLRSMRAAAGFTAILTALYEALYVLLQSEDYALLLGAGLLFGILTAIMVVTRNVDWYRIASPQPTAP